MQLFVFFLAALQPSIVINHQSASFDNFPRPALTIGGGILCRARARGTYYTALGLMDSTNELGRHFTQRDVGELLRAGTN
jgi:hypothetical protein